MADNVQSIIPYKAEPTARAFHASVAKYRGIMGPIGSGKSSACCMEILLRSMQQRPSVDGVRRTRWAVIRATYPQLKSTTIKTFCEWCPETRSDGTPFFIVNWQPPIVGHLRIPLPDGTRMDMEVFFVALDKDEDVEKLKSMELTGGWINEASEIPRTILDMLYGRTDRYPSKRMGGTTWHGVIMDTNPPDDDSWYYKLAEIERPIGYEFFKQPPAVLKVPKKHPDDPQVYAPNQGQAGYPSAENVQNHNAGYDYYMTQIPGKTDEWIKVFLMGEYGSISSGKPVYPEYRDGLHSAKTDIVPLRGVPLILGFDFGRTPAGVICQLSPRGQFRILEEIFVEDMGVREYIDTVLKPLLRNKYADVMYSAFGDPAGSGKQQTSDDTCFEAFRDAGIRVEPARTNELVARREAVVRFLNRNCDGQPGLQLSPCCQIVRKGFMGEYHYRKIRVSGTDRYAEVPDKNRFSHLHDALQYACLEAESGATMMSTWGGSSVQGPGVRRQIVDKGSLGWT